MEEIDYCKDAKRWLNKVVICGTDCPYYNEKCCPRIIAQDAGDRLAEKMIRAINKMGKIKGEKK